jgi:hypothetical protein
MKERHWAVYCLMDDFLLDGKEPSDARRPVEFSGGFLRGNMIEHASIGQLRKIVGCLQHNAARRAAAFGFYVENFGDRQTTEKLDFMRGLAIQAPCNRGLRRGDG